MRVDDAQYDGCLICFNGQVSVFEMFRVARIGELYIECRLFFGIFDSDIQIEVLIDLERMGHLHISQQFRHQAALWIVPFRQPCDKCRHLAFEFTDQFLGRFRREWIVGFVPFSQRVVDGSILHMAIGHLRHIDQYVSVVVQYVYQTERVHFNFSYSLVLLRVVAVIVISEIDVARFIPILREPVSPAVRDLDMHGTVKGAMSLFAVG